jgi:hypothetical protein
VRRAALAPVVKFVSPAVTRCSVPSAMLGTHR